MSGIADQDLLSPDSPTTGNDPLPFTAPRRGGGNGGGRRPRRKRVRWLRLSAILAGFGVLAVISMMFGMLMAVASDLPQLENRQQYKHEANSFIYDDRGRLIGLFAPPNHTVIVNYNQISPWMRKAIVAVEDKRFWSEPGFDVKGILRAAWADVTGGATQGASTIAEQFVKNALAEQNNRTILEKLREAALAFQLTHRWSRQKILTEYLNSVYFGNGAYGIESAARIYFGKVHGYESSLTSGGNSGCGDSTPKIQRPECASVLQPWEAALLAGMVDAPSAFNPVASPAAARARRNLVLKDMLEQRYISLAQYQVGIAQPLPTAADLEQAQEPSAAPYFTDWIRPDILHAMGLGRGVSPNVAEYRAYYGGLKIRTTIDLRMQQAADQAVYNDLPHGTGMTASLVTIDNHTGEVRAMVGGPVVGGQEDYHKYPFNLAADGHRQPGSSFKPFTLALALENGISPDSIWTSAPQNLMVATPRGREQFVVRNFANSYSGKISLAAATAVSDNSVFAQVGARVGVTHIAALARRMGIRSPISENASMILGGLHIGVSALDMAHAYETIATGGLKVYNPVLGSADQGPIGIHSITCPVCAHTGIPTRMVNHPAYERVLPPAVANEVHQLLTGVVTSGTGTKAGISGVEVAGKTGTTSNYGDAWFVGWTPQLTTAVWVGFPNKLVPMLNQYNGQPVEGGTLPAIIWHDFMTKALQILAQENPSAHVTPPPTVPAVTTPVTPAATPTTPAAPVTPAAPPATTPSTPAAPPPTTPTTPTPTTPTTPTPHKGPGTGGGPGGGKGGTHGTK